MKKTLLLTILALSLVFTGCNFSNLAVPEEVIVKTDATYNFNIANFDSTKNDKLDFSQYLDIQKMLTESMGNSESSETKFNVYKYNNGTSEFQQLLLHMPIKEIEFDFGENFKNLDFSKAIQGFDIPEKEFTVPNITELSQTQDLDLTTIRNTITKAISFGGATANGENSPIFADDGVFSFEAAEFTSGKLVIDATITDAGQYLTAKATLKDKNGNIIASNTFTNGKAELSFENATFTYTGMKLVIENANVSAPFLATFDDSSKLKRITKVTLPSNDPKYNLQIPDVDISFPFSLPDSLGNVTINQGSLTVDISEPTPEWSGDVIDSYTIKLSGGIGGTNGITVNKTNKTATLVDEELHNEEIKAESHVNIKLVNATIDFEKTPTVNVEVKVQEISAEIDMPEGFTTTVSQDMDVPEELTNFVKEITWEKTGFDIKYVNKLPVGNDIQLKITSNFLGLTDNTPKTLAAGGKNATEQTVSFVNENPPKTEFEGANAVSKMDVTGEIQLPGTTPGKLKVSNVVPGETYSIAMTIEPKFDWTSAKIKMPENANYQGSFNTGINKKAMFESLGEDMANKLDKIQIEKLPLYIFANIPDIGLGDDAGVQGLIKAYYATQGDGENDPIVPVTDSDPIYILGEEDASVQGGWKKKLISPEAMPVLTKNANDEVTNDFSGYQDINFTEALNATTSNKDATLFIDYDVGIGGTAGDNITIYADKLKQLQEQGKSAIRLDVAIVLSLDFSVTEPIKIDLLELMNKSDEENGSGSGSGSGSSGSSSSEPKDLLGRDAPTDISAYEQYLSVVKSANVTISNVKLPFKGEITLSVDIAPDDDTIKPQTTKFGDGTTTNIKLENPVDLIKQYPLNPKVELIIGKEGGSTSFGLKRDSSFGGKLSVGVHAKGEIKAFPIENKDSNNGGNE